MQVPPQLQYNQLQPRGFFSTFKQWPIEPIAFSGQFWPGQIIRIALRALTDGVMDPYRSHIEITVETDINLLPVGQLQVDNSAQSFIGQMVISSKNRQVQRINEYGVLAAYLTDIGLSQHYAQGRQTQGLGFTNIPTKSALVSNQPSGNCFYAESPVDGKWQPRVSAGTIFPTIPSKIVTDRNWGQNWMSIASQSSLVRSHTSPINPAWLPQVDVWWWNIYITGNSSASTFQGNSTDINVGQYGYAYNIRAEYLAPMSSNKYPDSTSSLCNYQLELQYSVHNGVFPAKFQNNTVYNTYQRQQLNNYFWDEKNSQQISNVMPNINSIQGFTNLYSPQFARGTNQPFISPTVPQCQFQDGLILQYKIPVQRKTFKIPIISSIIGLLIPQDQFILLPLQSLNDLLMEFTIDQHAMFTSGYNDIGQYDNVGMGLMQKRAFKVVRVVYNLHTYQFFNPQLDQYLKVNLQRGLAINTHFWQMGNQYQIENSQSLSNSWPVACNQQALDQILILFYPLDYQIYSFCRKHFRISNNITKFQLRINMDYYPSQPYSGNAGNPVQLDATGDNSVFLQNIFYSNNYMFSNLSPAPRINKHNFAINGRPYNITNTNTFYDPAMLNNSNYQWYEDSVNADTAMGMAAIHQNRFVGKAAYLKSFNPYAHSSGFLTGLNCKNAKQFDVILTCNPTNWFPRPQIMFIYTRSSNLIQYGKNGIINVSK